MANPPTPPKDEKAALASLESFVMDNDGLVELEARIGRFNIFDALRIVRAEIRHSNFLGWLLDPSESHGAGQTFLRAVLMDMLRQCPHGLRPYSPVELDGLDLGRVDVRREFEGIDLLVTCERPGLAVAVENKIDSSEHSNQLVRYREIVAQRFPGVPVIHVFLTKDRAEPSDPAWLAYGYADLHSALSRTRRLHHGSLGDDVLAFLDHYLRMIGSRLMDDPKIDELCDRIYRSHRQALDIIFERRGDPRQQLITEFSDVLTAAGYPGRLSDRSSTSCRFTPKEWMDLLPPVSSRPQLPAQDWMALIFTVKADMRRALVSVTVGPTTDPDVRNALLLAIKKHGKEYGFSLNRSKLTDRWTRVYSETVIRSDEQIEVDDANLATIRESAERMPDLLRRMTGLLRTLYA